MVRTNVNRWLAVAGGAALLLSGAFGFAAPCMSRRLAPIEQSVVRGGCATAADQRCQYIGGCADSFFTCDMGACSGPGSCGSQTDGFKAPQCAPSAGGKCAEAPGTLCQEYIECDCVNVAAPGEAPNWLCGEGDVYDQMPTDYCLSN